MLRVTIKRVLLRIDDMSPTGSTATGLPQPVS